MSQRNWREYTPLGVGLAVIIALIATGLVNHQKQPERGNDRAKQHSENTLKGVDDPRVAPVARLETPPANPKPERNEWRAEQDLQAQWEMAKWAYYTSVAAFITVFVTAVGVWFVRQTLIATRATIGAAAQAAEAAGRQAEAATEGNRLAQIAYAAEQRPWVTFVGFQLASGISYEGGNATVTIQFRIQNSGRTPALNVDFATEIYSLGSYRTIDMRAEQARFIASVRARAGAFGYLAAPGRVIAQNITMSINKEEIDRIRATDFRMLIPVVMVCVRYQPTFSNEVFVTGEVMQVFRGVNSLLPIDGPDIPASDLTLINSPMGLGFAT